MSTGSFTLSFDSFSTSFSSGCHAYNDAHNVNNNESVNEDYDLDSISINSYNSCENNITVNTSLNTTKEPLSHQAQAPDN